MRSPRLPPLPPRLRVKKHPSTPHPIPSHANIKYSSFPLTPSTQTTYPPPHPPPPPTPFPPPPPSAAPPIPSPPAVLWNQGANPLTVAGPVSGPFVARFSDLSPLNSFIINKRVRPSGPRMARFARTGVLVNEPQTPSDPRAALDLGRLLGQRRAFGAVAGRCSAAHAQLLRRMRDEKLYLPLAPSWRDFCGVHLAISRRHADRLIGFLNRFGP